MNLISRMLERGYTFATISELLHAAHHGMRVEQVLRGSPKGGRFRNFKRAATITIAELKKTLNATDRSIALSQKLGLLVKDGTHYAIKTPELLEGAEVLVKAGVDLELLLDRWVRVQEDLEDVAKSFVGIITDKYFDENLPTSVEKGITKMADLIQTVRQWRTTSSRRRPEGSRRADLQGDRQGRDVLRRRPRRRDDPRRERGPARGTDRPR